jgi:hypothetical protein
LVDDLYGDVQLRAIEQTGSLYKVASWHNVMAIAYSNAARHAAVAGQANRSHANPLFGSPPEMHLGMGFHIAAAWTVLLNLVDALYEACVEEADGGDPKGPGAAAFPEPPTKYRGGLGPTDAVRREWEANLEAGAAECGGNRSRAPLPAAAGPPPHSTGACAYAWMVNRQASVSEPRHVAAALRPVLAASGGWRARGYPIRQPRTGWYAGRSGPTPRSRWRSPTSQCPRRT